MEAGLAAETGSGCYGHVMGDYSLVRRTQNEVLRPATDATHNNKSDLSCA